MSGSLDVEINADGRLVRRGDDYEDGTPTDFFYCESCGEEIVRKARAEARAEMAAEARD